MQQPILHLETGKLLKTGRLRPDPAKPRYKFRAAKYMRRAMPKAPDSLAASPLAQPCMDRMLLNDELSLCTCVTSMKCSAQVLGDAGTGIIYDNEEAANLYRWACGWDGTPDTDNGGNEDDVIDYVTAHGIEKGLHHWAGKISVDGSNPDEVRSIVSLTKNLFFGVELPDAWLQVEAGAILTKAGGPIEANGHAFPSGGRKGHYTPDGVVVTLWGDPAGGSNPIECLMPWDVLAEFTANAEGGELHSMISKDALRKGLNTTASGFDWSELAEDFRVAGGSLA